ncbi:MAG: hypothetical protein PF501_13490 [Salinisphaera sp.]|jgi:hypothetical protein|nr:hypothetical protein [Salinisphaera sp.]
MKRMTLVLALVAAALLTACANSPYRNTRLIDVQPNLEAQAQPPYKTPVVGVLVDTPDRAALENAIVAQLRADGVNARAAMPIFGTKGTKGKSRAYLARRLHAQGFDSAIGIHLLHKKIENLQVAGGPSAPAPPAAGLTMSPDPLGPDFSLNETTYITKINFWDIKQQAIVWSATSITHNPNGLEAGSTQFAKVVASQLIKAGLFSQ